MAELALSDLHEPLRLLLGDEGDSVAGYDIDAERLDAALRSVIVLGHLPCAALNGAKDALAETPSHQDTLAFLVTKAAHLFAGGERAEMIRTRAMSVSTQPTAVRDRLHLIEFLLEEIESRGNVCGSATNATTGLFEASEDYMTHIEACLSDPPPDLCCP